MIQKLLKGDEFSPQDRDFINEAAYLIAAYGNTTPEGKYGYSKFKFPYMNSRMELERDNFRRAIGLRIPYWSAVVQHNKNMDILNKYYNNLPGERISLKKISVPKRIYFAYSNVSPEDIEMGKRVDLTNEENYRMYRKYPLLLLQYLEGGELKKDEEPPQWLKDFVGDLDGFYDLYRSIEAANIKDHNPYFLQRLNMGEGYESFIPNKRGYSTHLMASDIDKNGDLIMFPLILRKSPKNHKLKKFSLKRGKALDRALKTGDYISMAPLVAINPKLANLSLELLNTILLWYSNSNDAVYKRLHPEFMKYHNNLHNTSISYFGGSSDSPLLSALDFKKLMLKNYEEFRDDYMTDEYLRNAFDDFIMEKGGEDFTIEEWDDLWDNYLND